MGLSRNFAMLQALCFYIHFGTKTRLKNALRALDNTVKNPSNQGRQMVRFETKNPNLGKF
jgi:hypothetical protein